MIADAVATGIIPDDDLQVRSIDKRRKATVDQAA